VAHALAQVADFSALPCGVRVADTGGARGELRSARGPPSTRRSSGTALRFTTRHACSGPGRRRSPLPQRPAPADLFARAARARRVAGRGAGRRREMRWLEGASLVDGGARFVPAAIALVPFQEATAAERIALSTSTGVACGGHLGRRLPARLL